MTCRSPAWWTDVREVDVLDALNAVGIAPSTGKGRSGRWTFGHRGKDGGTCNGLHSSGEAAIFLGTQAHVLKCRICDATLTALEIVAASIGYEVPTHWEESRLAPVRAAAASYGWCEGQPGTWTPADQERAAGARQARLEAIAAADAERARKRAAEGIDVTAAWETLQSQGFDPGDLRAWACGVRGWPQGLVEHLPLAEVAFARLGLPGAAGRLCTDAVERGYCLLLALRDAAGIVQSVERRWPAAGTPPPGQDGKPRKTLALPSDLIKAGPAGEWAGGVRIFGQLPAAVRAAAECQPVVLLEGGPDFLVAAATLRWAGQGEAVGAPSVGEQPKIAAAFRDACVAAGVPPHRVRVVVVAHVGKAGEEAGAASVRALEGARVKLATLPTWAGDLADVAKGWGRVEVLHRIVTQAPRLLPIPFEQWPECFQATALRAGEKAK
ncbi:MAG: hypothetical protein EKK55_10390 [Rhodocyclaceae bacterium]|nr:MAG: hypothetical protein EKK55_10390 [Rhodocyclaceae bacterium]